LRQAGAAGRGTGNEIGKYQAGRVQQCKKQPQHGYEAGGCDWKWKSQIPRGENPVDMKRSLPFVFAAALLCTTPQRAVAQDAAQLKAQEEARAMLKIRHVKSERLNGANMNMTRVKSELASSGTTKAASLPLFLYDVESSRDNNNYAGVIVGADPFSHRGEKDAHVPTFIVPLIITVNTVGVNWDPKTGTFQTASGTMTFDPTIPTSCFAPPNNVPLTLTQQSPIFGRATYSVGGTEVGDTQYIDSLQRAEFWEALGDNHIRDDYHLRLSPVRTLPAVQINVPAAMGTTLPANPFNACEGLGIVDFNWFDNYLQTVLIPQLQTAGVNPANFPILLTHNVVTAVAPITFVGDCCFLGYHNFTGTPIQTYSPSDFDTTGVFGGPANGDTDTLAHEVGEWANDPFVTNPVPAWGNTGQDIGFCQNNLEVGDPLSGTNFSPIAMPNGFTYHLQELAFFSWFYGAPGVGIHGWFSNNGTFLTDAGPVCSLN